MPAAVDSTLDFAEESSPSQEDAVPFARSTTCSICGKTLSRISNLRNHMHNIHGQVLHQFLFSFNHNWALFRHCHLALQLLHLQRKCLLLQLHCPEEEVCPVTKEDLQPGGDNVSIFVSLSIVYVFYHYRQNRLVLANGVIFYILHKDEIEMFHVTTCCVSSVPIRYLCFINILYIQNL